VRVLYPQASFIPWMASKITVRWRECLDKSIFDKYLWIFPLMLGHFSQRNSRQKEDIKSGSQEDPQGQQELRPPVGQQRHYRRLKSPLGHPDVGAPGKPSASTSCLAPLDSAGASSKSSSFTSAGNFSKLALLDANIDVTAHPNIPLNTTQSHPDSGFVR
jgi:hypothetical protein